MKDRVLLVDEEPRFVAALRRRLCQNFDVMTAASNEDALRLLRTAGPFAVAVRKERSRLMRPFLEKLEEHAPGTGRIVFGDQPAGAGPDGRVHWMAQAGSRSELVRAIENCISCCRQEAPMPIDA